MNGFLEFMLKRAFAELMMFLFLWVPLLLLALVCVLTLNHLPPQRRRGLFALFFLLLGLAAVLFGGAWLLDRNGLAWRTWIQEGMSMALWLAGLVTGIMTVVYARRWLPELYKGWGKATVYLSALCLISTMCVGSVAGMLWCMGPGEQVVTYAGEMAVLAKWTWMDISYSVYEYHGPLVRGAEAVPELDWSLLRGAVIDAG